jgi:hypothetical protein
MRLSEQEFRKAMEEVTQLRAAQAAVTKLSQLLADLRVSCQGPQLALCVVAGPDSKTVNYVLGTVPRHSRTAVLHAVEAAITAYEEQIINISDRLQFKPTPGLSLLKPEGEPHGEEKTGKA